MFCKDNDHSTKAEASPSTSSVNKTTPMKQSKLNFEKGKLITQKAFDSVVVVKY
jgi:hypothetical protein